MFVRVFLLLLFVFHLGLPLPSTATIYVRVFGLWTSALGLKETSFILLYLDRVDIVKPAIVSCLRLITQ